jgi:predicted Zn finger-like uncharacterized protein
MKDFVSSRSTPSAVDAVPASCPFCHSSSIVTTAKGHDADAYWRCEKCGELWNVSRSQPTRYDGRRWR